MTSDLTMREYVDLVTGHLVEMESLRHAALSEALRLQAAEYERRLNTLNHEHARAVEVQHTYVTQEKFDDFVSRYQSEKATTEHALTLAAGNKEGSKTSLKNLYALLGAGFTILMIVVVVINLATGT